MKMFLSFSQAGGRSVARILAVSLALTFVVASVSAAGQLSDVPIAYGSATVDGDLSDWAGADWLISDKVYDDDGWYRCGREARDPFDLSGAKWAARWTPDMIYIAGTITDTDHVFVDNYTTRNGQDALQLFVNAGSHYDEGYDQYIWGAHYYTAQHYHIGAAPDGSDWMVLGNECSCSGDLLDVEANGIVPEFAVSVDGDVINYEIAVLPYKFFRKDDVAGSDFRTLEPGMQIGLDVVFDSKAASDGGFGMLSEFTWTGKRRTTGCFRNFTLAEGTVALQGDLDSDGFVGSSDLDIVRANWGASVPVGDLSQGDPSGDGMVGSADLDIVRGNWGMYSGAATVPEPASLLLLLTVVGSFGFLRRRA